MVNYEHVGRPSNPHWKGDTSSLEDPKNHGYGASDHKVPANALNIIWGNDNRFWQWIKLSEEETRLSGFEEGAMLVQVNWIEITGKLPKEMFRIATKYEMHYVVKFCIDAFGWHSVPIKFKVKINGEETVRSVLLEPYRKKPEKWHEIYGGEFTFMKSTINGCVEIGMLEVESEWWKGSMVLAGIKIKPKTE